MPGRCIIGTAGRVLPGRGFIPEDYGGRGHADEHTGSGPMAEQTAAAPAAGDAARRRITVVVADDQRLVRHGFRVILQAEPDIEGGGGGGRRPGGG